MNFKTLVVALTSCGLVACSANSLKQAGGSFDYAKRTEAKPITIPSGLKSPEQQADFDIPNNINFNGPVGSKVDIRAPSMVLPIAASSRVEANSADARVWFDQVYDDDDLSAFLHQIIEKKLRTDGVSLTKTADGNYQTGWYEKIAESDYWLFKVVDMTERRRYLISYDKKPHGRSVSIEVKLTDYVKEERFGKTDKVDLIDKKRAEMAMLNELIAQIDYQYRVKNKESRLARASQQIVTVGENKQGEPAYLVDIQKDSLWDAMPFFFRDYGFTVTDLNEAQFIYYVDHEKNSGIFSFLGLGNDNALDVDEAKYQFALTEISKQQTSVTIYDENGEPLSQEVLMKLFPQIEQGLSFKNLF